MPIDTNIAMGYRGVDIPNPLNAFAQMQQIQNYQQNNALGQMKMDEMRRGVEEQNRLRSTLSGFAPDMKVEDQVNQLARGGFLDQARKLAESHAKASKDIRDTEKSAFEVQKLKREDLAQRMRDLASDPSDNRVTAHISAIMASPLYSDQDKQLVLKDAQGLMSQPPEQRAIVFSKYGASASDLKPQNISQNLGGSIRELQIGPMGKATVIPGTEAAISVSPDAQLRANVQARGQDMAADARAAKGANLKPIPPHVNTAIIKNDQSLNQIDKAIGLLSGALEGGDKDATGLKGYLPNQILNRAYPEGVKTRAVIADIGSLKLHDRSGAAVTASEFPRLAPFIPSEKDDPKTALVKLKQLRAVAAGEQEALQSTYSEDQGYKPSPVGRGAPAPSSPAAKSSGGDRDSEDLAAINREISRTKPGETGRLEILNQEKRAIQQRIGQGASGALTPAEQAELEALRQRFKR